MIPVVALHDGRAVNLQNVTHTSQINDHKGEIVGVTVYFSGADSIQVNGDDAKAIIGAMKLAAQITLAYLSQVTGAASPIITAGAQPRPF